MSKILQNTTLLVRFAGATLLAMEDSEGARLDDINYNNHSNSNVLEFDPYQDMVRGEQFYVPDSVHGKVTHLLTDLPYQIAHTYYTRHIASPTSLILCATTPQATFTIEGTGYVVQDFRIGVEEVGQGTNAPAMRVCWIASSRAVCHQPSFRIVWLPVEGMNHTFLKFDMTRQQPPRPIPGLNDMEFTVAVSVETLPASTYAFPFGKFQPTSMTNYMTMPYVIGFIATEATSSEHYVADMIDQKFHFYGDENDLPSMSKNRKVLDWFEKRICISSHGRIGKPTSVYFAKKFVNVGVRCMSHQGYRIVYDLVVGLDKDGVWWIGSRRATVVEEVALRLELSPEEGDTLLFDPTTPETPETSDEESTCNCNACVKPSKRSSRGVPPSRWFEFGVGVVTLIAVITYAQRRRPLGQN